MSQEQIERIGNGPCLTDEQTGVAMSNEIHPKCDASARPVHLDPIVAANETKENLASLIPTAWNIYELGLMRPDLHRSPFKRVRFLRQYGPSVDTDSLPRAIRTRITLTEQQFENRQALLIVRTQLRNREQPGFLKHLLEGNDAAPRPPGLSELNVHGAPYRQAVFSALLYRIFRVNQFWEFERRPRFFDHEDYRLTNYGQLVRCSGCSCEQVRDALLAFQIDERTLDPNSDGLGNFWIRLAGPALMDSLTSYRNGHHPKRKLMVEFLTGWQADAYRSPLCQDQSAPVCIGRFESGNEKVPRGMRRRNDFDSQNSSHF